MFTSIKRSPLVIPELRLAILRYLCPQNEEIKLGVEEADSDKLYLIPSHSNGRPNRNGSTVTTQALKTYLHVIQTCAEFETEAAKALYATNTFHFDSDLDAQSFAEAIGPVNANLIRKVTLSGMFWISEYTVSVSKPGFLSPFTGLQQLRVSIFDCLKADAGEEMRRSEKFQTLKKIHLALPKLTVGIIRDDELASAEHRWAAVADSFFELRAVQRDLKANERFTDLGDL